MLTDERANAAMSDLLDRARVRRVLDIDSELERYLSDGLVVHKDGSVISVAASKESHAERNRFADRVDYEAFVNKIHVDDWSGEALTTATVEEKLAHVLALADRVGAWAEARGISIAVVVSAQPTTRDVVFRFHGVRSGEIPWLAQIEQYAEPVLLRLYRPAGDPDRG